MNQQVPGFVPGVFPLSNKKGMFLETVTVHSGFQINMKKFCNENSYSYKHGQYDLVLADIGDVQMAQKSE